MSGLIVGHLFQYGPAFLILFGKFFQMVVQMRFDLPLGFRDEPEAGPVAGQPGERAQRDAAGVPERRQQTDAATQFIDASGAPRKVVAFLQRRCLEHGTRVGCPGGKRLTRVQRLGGNFAGVIDTHQRGAEIAFDRGHVAIGMADGRVRSCRVRPRCERSQGIVGDRQKQIQTIEIAHHASIILRHPRVQGEIQRTFCRFFADFGSFLMLKRSVALSGRLAGFVLAGQFLATAASAQGDEDTVSGRATLGFLSTTGNTESTNTNARLRLRYVPNEWSHEWDLSAVGATREEETTTEAYTGRYVARRAWGRSFMFAALDWNKNRFAAYQRQRSESLGYGHTVVDTDNHEFNVEAGLGRRFARRIDGATTEEAIARATLDYEWTLNSTTSFAQELVVESGSSNTRTESVSALRARLFTDIALVVSYRLRRDSDVPPGSVRTDIFSSVSLEYAF